MHNSSNRTSPFHRHSTRQKKIYANDLSNITKVPSNPISFLRTKVPSKVTSISRAIAPFPTSPGKTESFIKQAQASNHDKPRSNVSRVAVPSWVTFVPTKFQQILPLLPLNPHRLLRPILSPSPGVFAAAENFIKARSAVEISDSMKRPFGRLMPWRCNADNPALLISCSNLPGTRVAITSYTMHHASAAYRRRLSRLQCD